MTKVNKIGYAFAISLLMTPSTLMAASTNIDATANFRAAITLGNEVDMDFGQIDYTGTPGAGDTVALGTDGNLTSGGNFSAGATGTAGSVDILTGTDGLTVDIFCDATATMTETGGGSIDVTSIEVATEGNETTSGAANACAGMGTAATSMVLAVGGASDQITLGGTIDGATAASFVGGAYSTANAGGDDIQIDVVYQ